MKEYMEQIKAISIHAPVKGATRLATTTPTLVNISIHAPVKGATTAHGELVQCHKFQSTLP